MPALHQQATLSVLLDLQYMDFWRQLRPNKHHMSWQDWLYYYFNAQVAPAMSEPVIRQYLADSAYVVFSKFSLLYVADSLFFVRTTVFGALQKLLMLPGGGNFPQTS